MGTAAPSLVYERVRILQALFPTLEVHFHDDRGFGLINALQAIRAGANYVDTTVLGIGERSGITSMTGLIFNLFVDQRYDHLEGYNLRGSTRSIL